MQKEENMLRAEIEFWRQMIESQIGDVSELATERMLRACELAERRLMTVAGESFANETRQ
jgi:hypothetical protein